MGSNIPRGTQVKIFISRGGKPAEVVVPDVAGLTVSAAKAKLLQAGYAVVSEPQPSQAQFFVKSDTVPKGSVIGTEPAYGTAAPVSSAILLIISTGP
jgi:serine/threonine-protein kinase